MYIGHVILLAILAVVLLSALLLQRKIKRLFSNVCITIALFFTYLSIQYFFDVILNKSSEGIKLTFAMRLLTQNEDFVSRNGYYFGLYWGLGVVAVMLILLGISLARSKKTKDSPDQPSE